MNHVICAEYLYHAVQVCVYVSDMKRKESEHF